jgi:DNA-binding LacI/PurR family transcriptional regulator
MVARQVTVAVVIDRYQYAAFGGFIPLLVSNLVQVLSRREVAVELCTEHSLSRLRGRLLDGVLAMAWDDETVAELSRLKDVPVVTLNRMDVPGLSAVATDHYADGATAVRYFAEHGHKRIAMVCEEQNNWGSLERVAGFRAELSARGMEVDERLVAFTEHQPMYGLMRRLLSLQPTAIFVANESLGLEAAYILRDVLGVRVPQDVSLIGMESAQVSQFVSPPLTAIAQPLDELADAALELLMRQIANGGGPERVLVRNRLIERESVATLPSAPDAPAAMS